MFFHHCHIKIFKKLITVIILLLLLYFIYVINSTNGNIKINKNVLHMKRPEIEIIDNLIPEKYNENIIKTRIYQAKIKRLTSNINSLDNNFVNSVHNVTTNNIINNIHIFYYAPVKWCHNNDSRSSIITKDNKFNTIYYPKRDFYNISDNIFNEHFIEIQKTGIGVIVLNWTPFYPIKLLINIFEILKNYKIKLTIQIDEYPERTIESIRNSIKFFYDFFNAHLSYYKIYIISRQQKLPLIYIKNSYLIEMDDWQRLLTVNGILSIRNTIYNCIIIGQIDTKEQLSPLRRSGFDGFYSYHASNGYYYTSTWKNWAWLKKFADRYNLLFIPTVSAGYEDTLQQTKHKGMKRHRSNGQYFSVAWRTSITLHTPLVTVSSYNNWLEGTQIEPALPKSGFKDYQPGTPYKYLDLLRYWTHEFYVSKNGNNCNDFINNTIC